MAPSTHTVSMPVPATPEGVPQADADTMVELVCHYYPGHPGRMYLSNGDPGYSDDPADVELLTVQYQGNTLLDTHPLAAFVFDRFGEVEEFYTSVEEKIDEQLGQDYDPREDIDE